MTSALVKALVKVTIETARRSIDVALPGDVRVAELLPYVLRHAGDEAPDAGERHGGWILRRPTGEIVDSTKTLTAQQVRDGELLRLVPGQEEWPELDYDDVVEMIASGVRRHRRRWSRAATRRCGLAVCGGVLTAGTSVAFTFEPPWIIPGLVMLGIAAALTFVGVVVARAVPDTYAGALFAGCGLPYAFLGGLLVGAPDGASTVSFEPPHLLLASVMLVVFGLAGYVGVTAPIRIFAAAITIGVLAAQGAMLADGLAPQGVAAVVLAVGIGLLPGYPMAAIRLGRIPLPSLPQRAVDLLADDPMPPTPSVFAAAVRADEILSGLVLGLSVVSGICSTILLASGAEAAILMVATITAALLLRARLFSAPRQRIPLLVSGLIAAAGLVGAAVGGAQSNTSRALLLLAVCGVGGLIAAAGLLYSRKTPSPYLGRIADIVDVIAITALIPFACYLTGFFDYMQGLMASAG